MRACLTPQRPPDSVRCIPASIFQHCVIRPFLSFDPSLIPVFSSRTQVRHFPCGIFLILACRGKCTAYPERLWGWFNWRKRLRPEYFYSSAVVRYRHRLLPRPASSTASNELVRCTLIVGVSPACNLGTIPHTSTLRGRFESVRSTGCSGSPTHLFSP